MEKIVLVVDDQPALRQLIIEFLTMENYRVEAAADGLEAIEKTKELQPDLILMDMKMPGMTGIETLKKMREMQLQAKTILMTAYGELELQDMIQGLGVLGFLNKPFDLADLARVVIENID